MSCLFCAFAFSSCCGWLCDVVVQASGYRWTAVKTARLFLVPIALEVRDFSVTFFIVEISCLAGDRIFPTPGYWSPDDHTAPQPCSTYPPACPGAFQPNGLPITDLNGGLHDWRVVCCDALFCCRSFAHRQLLHWLRRLCVLKL